MSSTGSVFRPVLVCVAFLAYAAAVLSMHGTQKSAWDLEHPGGIALAASYLYYGKPFGLIDSGLWDRMFKRARVSNTAEAEPPELFLQDAAAKRIPAGPSIPVTTAGYGLGYSYFATAALSLFGPRTFSLTLGFVIVLGASVLLFVLGFQDQRTLAAGVLLGALTLFLLTPSATDRGLIDQGPIGGYRFFVVAGILPALHIMFELFDCRTGERLRNLVLTGLQLLVLLAVASVRLSAVYFLVALVFAAAVLIWWRPRDHVGRRAIVRKVALLAAVGVVLQLGAHFAMPRAHKELGMLSDPAWHRTFVGLGLHPEWPFGNLADAFDCKREVPGALSRGLLDSNGFCAYYDAVNKGAAPAPLFGAGYEKLVRKAFFRVVREYPRQVLETYLLYKPLGIWRTLSTGASLHISAQNVPAAIALAVEAAVLILLLLLTPRRYGFSEIVLAFALVSGFSLAPPLIAWSSPPTSPDIITYMYAWLLLILLGIAAKIIPTRRLFAGAAQAEPGVMQQ